MTHPGRRAADTLGRGEKRPKRGNVSIEERDISFGRGGGKKCRDLGRGRGKKKAKIAAGEGRNVEGLFRREGRGEGCGKKKKRFSKPGGKMSVV